MVIHVFLSPNLIEKTKDYDQSSFVEALVPGACPSHNNTQDEIPKILSCL